MPTPRVLLAVLFLLSFPSLALADGREGFDNPALAVGVDRVTISPYVDLLNGITCTVLADGNLTGQLGIVKSNAATWVCVDPLNANQKLGTTTPGFGEIGDEIGEGWLPIRLDFHVPVVSPAVLDVWVQTTFNATVRVVLYDADGNEIGRTESKGSNHQCGTCVPGGHECTNEVAWIAVGSNSSAPLAYAIIDTQPDAIFLIDDVAWKGNQVAVEPTTWGRVKALYR